MDSRIDHGVGTHPHHGNVGARGRHRAVVTLMAIVAMVGATVLVTPTATAAPGRVAVSQMTSFDAQMVSYINQARTSRGLSALHRAGGLTRLSVWWSTKMLAAGKLYHNPNAWTQVTKYGAANRTAWGENVGRGPSSVSAKALFNAYMNSPEHRANILSPKYHYVGMGTVSGDGMLYNTTEFTDTVEGAAPDAAAKKAAAKKAAAKKAAAKKAAAKKAAAKMAAAKKAAAKKAAAKKAAAKKPAAKKSSQQKTGHAKEGTQSVIPASYPKHDSKPKQASPAAAPTRVAGTVSTSFGSLSVPGVAVEIRDGGCDDAVTSGITDADGAMTATLAPGHYCAVVTATPGGVHTPDPVAFTVQDGEHDFTISWSELTPTSAPDPVARSGFTMRLL